jgi:hypothetical protein
MQQQYNGRLNIREPKTELLFQMYDKIPAKQCTTFRNPTEGLWDNSPLSRAFFSSANIRIIQNGIRARVYQMSGGKYTISEQDEATLNIIMRSTFLQKSANQPTNVPQQVEALNEIVFNYCVPQIYGECLGYNNYLNDVSSIYTLIEPPILSKTNDKQLQLNSFFGRMDL